MWSKRKNFQNYQVAIINSLNKKIFLIVFYTSYTKNLIFRFHQKSFNFPWEWRVFPIQLGLVWLEWLLFLSIMQSVPYLEGLDKLIN